jgi:hypothetical protein
MAKLPPNLSPHIKRAFKRASTLTRQSLEIKGTRPSTDDQYYWKRDTGGKEPSLLSEIRDVSKAVTKAVHDVKSIAHDPTKALHGPFRSMAEAIDDAIETAEAFYHAKLLRAMGDPSGAVDTSDTWDEAVPGFFEGK